MKRLLVALLLATLVGPAQAYGAVNHWERSGTSNDWNNGSNWELGIPATGDNVFIRSDVDFVTEEHVTIQSGDTGLGDWVRVGGGVYEDPTPVPLPDASLTIEPGANLYWQADGDLEFSSALAIGDTYVGTVHNYGTVDGFEYWPDWETDPWGPGDVQTPRISVGAVKTSGIEGGVGYLNLYDGSFTQAGALQVAGGVDTQGYVNVYAGASVKAQFSLEIGYARGDDCYGEFNLLGGSLVVHDTIDEEQEGAPGHHADIVVGTNWKLFADPASIGVANFDAGYVYVNGDFVLLRGTVRLGKDLEFTVGSHYIVNESWYNHGYNIQEPAGDPNDILTEVEIDIDPVTGVANLPRVTIVWDDMHMDGHLYVENSGDRPKEGDTFGIWYGDDDEEETHDGAFLSVTTNLVGGNAGYDDYLDGPSGIWGVEFTGLTGGDANGDHKVSIGDLSIMAGNWNQTDFTNGYADADFNGDGEVGIGDLSIMAGNWGWELAGGGVSVPEPATLSLLCLGGLALIRRKK